MAIDVQYEQWRQAGDPLTRPANWSADMAHGAAAPSTPVAPVTAPVAPTVSPTAPPVGAPVAMAAQPTPTTPLAPATDTTRPLGSTEFNNLRSEWTKSFNAAGITDINTINAQIEKNFITRNGAQISLKTNAPSLPSVLQGLSGFVPPKDTTLSTTPTPAASFGGGPTPITSLGVNLAQTTATSIETALAKLLQDQQTAAENGRAAAQAERDKAATGLETALAGQKGEDKLRALNEEMKIKETQASLQQILNQINNYKASLDMGLNAIDNTPIALEFQVGQKAALNRQAASTITALSSQAAVVQNQLQFAQNLVSQYYTAARQDRQDEITRYQTLYQMANDNLIELKADEKTAIDRQISLLSDINSRQMAEKDKVIELMMSNPDAWAKANVNLEMPYAEIAQKLSTVMAGMPQAGDYQSIESNGRLFTFDKKTGQYMDSGIKTTKQSVGGSGGGSGVTGTGGVLDAKFNSAVKDGLAQLQKGIPWGSVWNSIHQRFPNISSAQLDIALGGSGGDNPTGFGAPGAFEEYKAKQYKQSDPAKFEQMKEVWMDLSSPEGQDMTMAEKSLYVQKRGFSPSDFGLY